MNYIGSKKTLYPFLVNNMADFIGHNLTDLSFADMFSGTSIIGYNLLKTSPISSVVANDMEYYAFVLAKARIELYGQSELLSISQPYLEAMNSGYVHPYSDYIYREFSQNSLYLSPENAIMLDKARQVLCNAKTMPSLFYFLSASIIEAVDKVLNTASVHESYLKNLKNTALKPVRFQVPFGCFDCKRNYFNFGSKVFLGDASINIKYIPNVDIVYFDPPYNSRRYASNYHILNTVLNLDEPELRGKTRIPVTLNNSKFNSKKLAKESMSDLIVSARNKAKFCFISYSNEGIISEADYLEIIESVNPKRFDFATKNYSRYKADNGRNYAANSVNEYLYRIEF